MAKSKKVQQREEFLDELAELYFTIGGFGGSADERLKGMRERFLFFHQKRAKFKELHSAPLVSKILLGDIRNLNKLIKELKSLRGDLRKTRKNFLSLKHIFKPSWPKGFRKRRT